MEEGGLTDFLSYFFYLDYNGFALLPDGQNVVQRAEV